MNNKVLVSACLAGVECRYNGSHSFNKKLLNELKESEVIICCPELLAKEPIPRPACNIHNGDGLDVLNGKAKIIGVDNKDYTAIYLRGARKALEIAKKYNIKRFFLQSGSPTCGCGKIYAENGIDLKSGDGIFTALIKKFIPDNEIISL